MGRYATRESELDRLLRAERFVDLHAVARQAVRASVESYSLKELEAFYGFEREIPLREASLHLRALERAVELGKQDAVPEETVRGDRGLQPGRLHLGHAASRLAGGAAPGPRRRRGRRSRGRSCRRAIRARPSTSSSGASRSCTTGSPATSRPIRPSATRSSRRAGCSPTCSTGTAARRRRRGGSISACAACPTRSCWRRRRRSPGLAFVERVATPKRSVVDRYVFPPQECEIREGDTLHDARRRFAKVEAIDVARCTIDIRKGP